MSSRVVERTGEDLESYSTVRREYCPCATKQVECLEICFFILQVSM